MLYERWHETVKARHNDLALRDLASNRHWTFAELFAAGEARPADAAEIVCPQGHSPEFITSLIAAWRTGKIACPLEAGQTSPDIVSPGKECAHLKLTSGTTDTPRLIAFTGEQIAADAAQIVSAMGLRPDWPNLGVISLAHSYGFSNLVLPLLLHGIPLILAPAPLPEIIRRAASQETGMTLAAVPALWRAWHEVAAIPAQVRLAISAGAPLPLNLEQSVYATSGIKIHNFYGASECGGIAYDAGAAPRPDASLVGAPLPGVSLSLNDEGCLTVCNRAVGQTYWPHESASLNAGRFQSNDLAELKDGLVFLRGRAGDQINVAGRKVSPETIERALLLHPLVRDCVVFGAPEGDSARTETIVALVASTSGEADLRQFLLGVLPSWQVPRRWRIVESLPASPRGKISRAECRAQFMG
ncbi:MAG: class I adenylate-forming enzyme family protein [Verrucomicrobiota bacterium]|jgi:acyl-CoA synthetase (AMP-forming)/AMP-acid ligase II